MRPALLVLLVVVGAVVGCGRTPEPPPGTGPNPPGVDPPDIVDPRLEAADGRITLRWGIEDPTNVAGYWIFRGLETDSVPEFYESIEDVADSVFVDDAVVNDLVYQYEIASLIGTVQGRRSVTLLGAPGVFGITLEGGLDKTSGSNISPGTRIIDVGLVSPPRTIGYQLSEDPALAGAPVRPLGGEARFTLSSGDGPKTVYGRFVGPAGSQSEVVSDSIVLDTKAVIVSVTEDSGGGTLGVGSVLHLAVAVDSTGGAVTVDFTDGTTDFVSNLPCFDDGTFGDPVAGDGVYERDWTVPAGLGFTNALVRAEFQDDVGNVAVPTNAATRLTISSGARPAGQEGPAPR